jgi:hypothetical protein
MSDTEKQGRRTDILAAAKKVFARKGYHATTIADIAKAAKRRSGEALVRVDLLVFRVEGRALPRPHGGRGTSAA